MYFLALLGKIKRNNFCAIQKYSIKHHFRELLIRGSYFKKEKCRTAMLHCLIDTDQLLSYST